MEWRYLIFEPSRKPTQLFEIARTFPITISLIYSQEIWKGLSVEKFYKDYPNAGVVNLRKNEGSEFSSSLWTLSAIQLLNGEVNPSFLTFFNDTGLETTTIYILPPKIES